MEKKRIHRSNPPIKSVYHILFSFLFFSLVAFFFFARLFYPELSLFMIPDFGESDVVHLNIPLKEILASSLKNHTWPLWTPLLASGFPILAEGQIGTFYLPNLFFFRFFPTIVAYNINLILAFLLSFLGCLLLGRRLKLSPSSSLFFALVFTFSGFFAVHLNHFNLIQAASLLPLLFWAFLRLWKNPAFFSSLLFAFFLAQQLFTGHFYIVFITLLGILLLFLSLIFSTKKKNRREAVKKAGIAFLFSLLSTSILSSVQLLPTLELLSLSSRANGLSFNTITAFPYPLKHLLTFIFPYLFGDPRLGTYPPFSQNWGIFWENTAYIGIVPLSFALLAFFFWREKWVKTCFFLLIVSLFLVLGKNSPFYFVFSFFPFTLFRVPSKFLLLTTFSLTLLSSFFVEKMRKKWIGEKKFHLLSLFLLVSFLSFFLDTYRFSYTYPPTTPASFWTRLPESASFLQEKEGRIATIGAPVLWNDVFLTSGWQDMKPYLYFQNSLYPNLNVLFGIPHIQINTGGLTPNRVSLFTALTQGVEIDEKGKTASVGSITKNTLALGNVRHLITSFTIVDPAFILTATIRSPDGLPSFYIYENKKVLPRAYIAYAGKKIHTLEEFYKEVNSEDFLDRKEVLLEEGQTDFEVKEAKRGIVEITSLSPLAMRLETASETDGLLVIADTFYPGWKAYIDDGEVPVFIVNLNQRGVYLPAGNHAVDFRFESSSFAIGKKITYLSFLITSVMVFLSRVSFLQIISGTQKLSGGLSDKLRKKAS